MKKGRLVSRVTKRNQKQKLDEKTFKKHKLVTARGDVVHRENKLDIDVLCGMPTIQYSSRSGQLSVHKLFTSYIRRCLVSRDCD